MRLMLCFKQSLVSEGHIKKIYNMSLWKLKEKLDRNIVRSPYVKNV